MDREHRATAATPEDGARDMELTALHLEHGAEEYQASRPAIVQGTVHHTSLRDGLSVVSAQFALETALSSSVLLPPGLAVSLVLGGQAALRDGQCHGPGTYIIDLSTASRWRRLHAEAGQCFSFVSLNAPLHALDRLGRSCCSVSARSWRRRICRRRWRSAALWRAWRCWLPWRCRPPRR